MKPFDYHVATSAADAVATLADHPTGAYLAGGTNLVDHMKLGVAEPDLLVDVSRLNLAEITATDDGGVSIGANVRNSDLAAHPVIRSHYPMLSRALLSGASGQLRNAATTAGNLLQRTRCVYFQDVTTPCNKREPGSGCSALGGYVRYHAILGASPHCVATHPSDMAVAMTALDARVVVEGADGPRRIPATEFHRLPGDEPHRDTVLAHGELVTAVELPPPPADAVSDYRKVRDRAAFAFALVSVGAELSLVGDAIATARIALGGVAHRPWRARHAEEMLIGAVASDDVFAVAADAELSAAEPLPGNEFKVELARRTLIAQLRMLTERGRSMTVLEPRAIGTSVARRDGRAKVTGTATYAFEQQVDSTGLCAPGPGHDRAGTGDRDARRRRPRRRRGARCAHGVRRPASWPMPLTVNWRSCRTRGCTSAVRSSARWWPRPPRSPGTQRPRWISSTSPNRTMPSCGPTIPACTRRSR